MTLCVYRNALGAPRIGIHAARMPGDIARNDTIMTIAASLILTIIVMKASNTRSFFRLWAIIIVWLFLTGIVLHRLFCVRTTIDRFLFPS